jgi:hypothetical protein
VLCSSAVRRTAAAADRQAHWLTHAHTSHAVYRGATLPEVQATLGHGNIMTTSGYLHGRPENSSRQLSYKTHIFIAVRSNGMMTVIADCHTCQSRLRYRAKINEARDGYVMFALCTPTSILPASGNGNAVPKRYGPGRGL